MSENCFETDRCLFRLFFEKDGSKSEPNTVLRKFLAAILQFSKTPQNSDQVGVKRCAKETKSAFYRDVTSKRSQPGHHMRLIYENYEPGFGHLS